MSNNINKLLSLFLISVCFFFSQTALAQTGKNFWSHWGDSRAELNSYKLELPRYGENREGSTVLIYVTEDLGKQSQVKVDRPLAKGQKVKVLKLNQTRRFVTGIYDYAVMLSVFSPLSAWEIGGQSYPVATPIKLSMSSSEWCGNFYQQINARPEGYINQVHSYFDGEGDSLSTLAADSSLIFEDNLLVRVRELLQPFTGGAYQMLSSTLYSRFSHEAIKKVTAEIKREVLTNKVSTVLGDLPAVLYSVKTPQRAYKIWVENQHARRILKWHVKFLTGEKGLTERATLLSSFRSQYWTENHLKNKNLRAKLKLSSNSIIP